MQVCLERGLLASGVLPPSRFGEGTSFLVRLRSFLGSELSCGVLSFRNASGMLSQRATRTHEGVLLHAGVLLAGTKRDWPVDVIAFLRRLVRQFS